MIADFIRQHPEYEIVEISGQGLTTGIEYNYDKQLTKTARIWPHLADGDGHYCALLLKNKKRKNVLSVNGFDYMENMIADWLPRIHRDHLHLMPPETPSFTSIKMVKTGFYLGQFKSSGRKVDRYSVSARSKSKSPIRFEPAHAWFAAMKADDFAFTLRLSAEDELLTRYLRGETISTSEENFTIRVDRQVKSGDIIVICLGDYPLGYAKLQQGNLKNMYPAAWRLRS